MQIHNFLTVCCLCGLSSVNSSASVLATADAAVSFSSYSTITVCSDGGLGIENAQCHLDFGSYPNFDATATADYGHLYAFARAESFDGTATTAYAAADFADEWLLSGGQGSGFLSLTFLETLFGYNLSETVFLTLNGRSIAFDHEPSLQVPFTFGIPTPINVMASAYASSLGSEAITSSATLDLISIAALDQLGNPISGYAVASSAGQTYPLEGGTAVPEGRLTIPLVLGCLVLTVRLVRRRVGQTN